MDGASISGGTAVEGIAAPSATEEDVTRNSRRVGLSEEGMDGTLSGDSGAYRVGGEKSVSAIYVESTLSTSFPFASDFSLTLFHSASS